MSTDIPSDLDPGEQVARVRWLPAWVKGIAVVVVLFAVGAGLLAPGILASREAAHRSISSGHLKKIGMALHYYHEVFDTLPQAITADDFARPMHSWRVRVLPYLEEGDLFKQYRFNESWNGRENQKLLARRPAYFAAAGASSSGTTTNMLIVLDDETLWPSASAVKFKDVSDGLPNTLCVVEVFDRGIQWSQPDELTTYHVGRGINQPNGLKGIYSGGINGLFADTTVRFLRDDLPVETLRALVTRSGGEKIDLDALNPK